MQKDEVTMKKFISILLTTIIVLSIFVMPINVHGATPTSQAGIVTL